jgi:hypothetical protein
MGVMHNQVGAVAVFVEPGLEVAQALQLIGVPDGFTKGRVHACGP